ncbi:MAG: ABC transporter permease subunit [Planctomycetaceae bacterium]|nr:ABC transporter permease subunit [Planctomycetaceae bacterium]MCA9066455.1 ABC transporter permease subunit [Planctomycetaceae bacterium]
MPIHNLGYRPWDGTMESAQTRWTVITGIGVRRVWQSTWVRRIILLAWAPAVVMGLLIFLFEQAAQSQDPEAVEAFRVFVSVILSGSNIQQAIQEMGAQQLLGLGNEPIPIEESRHLFWSSLLMVVLKRTQLTLLVPMIGLIAPPLISQDIRSRAFLLYFSRPISQLQYIIGKAVTVLLYLSLVTLLPAMLLYITGVLLSPDLSIIRHTWDLPLRIIAAWLAIAVPTTSLALMLSSMTTESRLASFAWFTIWIFGFVATEIVRGASSVIGGSVAIELFSLFHLIGSVCEWLLDLESSSTADTQTRVIALCVLTCVSIAILFRRVSAPMKI